MKIAFVILNYNTYEETRDCILSVEDKLDTTDYRIVVVDNCSTDDSAKKIAEFIKDKEKVELICNSENIGFARGNNVGIAYVNKNFKPDFVAVCNSDTELISDNLTETLDNEYHRSNFALFGPYILGTQGENARAWEPFTVEKIKKELKAYEKEKKITESGLFDFYWLLCHWKNLVKYIVTGNVFKKDSQRDKKIVNCPEYQRQKVLAGCFLVFSKKFFEYMDGFDDRTFLYYEEDILYRHIIRHGLVTVYDPEVMIFHKHGVSTSKVAGEGNGLGLFRLKCLIESANILLTMI